MTTTNRRTGPPKLHRQPADTRIRPAESIVCPQGDEFGLDRDRFYRTSPKANPTRVTCPFCGTPTPLPKLGKS